jgi:hypothetical protein
MDTVAYLCGSKLPIPFDLADIAILKGYKAHKVRNEPTANVGSRAGAVKRTCYFHS